MKRKNVKAPRFVRRRVQRRQEKDSDEEMNCRYAAYATEKLGMEISQLRLAYQLSEKNKPQSDKWII